MIFQRTKGKIPEFPGFPGRVAAMNLLGKGETTQMSNWLCSGPMVLCLILYAVNIDEEKNLLQKLPPKHCGK